MAKTVSCHDHGNCELCDAIEAQVACLEGKLVAERVALEREIRVVIAATPRGDTDAPFWRGRLGSLLFVRGRILQGDD